MDLKPLALMLGSLALLWTGNFIQFDDTSGFGGDDMLMPYAGLALVAASASVILSLRDRRARRSLGAALLVLDCLIVVEARTNPGLRFIWSGDEGELFMFEVALLLGGLALLTRSVYRPTSASAPASARLAAPGGATPEVRAPEAEASDALLMPEAFETSELTGWARFVGYLAASTVLTFFAFFVGVAQFEATECGGSGSECTVSILGGFVWAAGAIVLSVCAIIATEASRQMRDGSPGA